MKRTINISLLLLLFYTHVFGQVQQYDYKRKLEGISATWHAVELPDDIFQKVSPDFRDIRIMGITAKGDTIEAPYILKEEKEKVISHKVTFKKINQSYNQQGRYFTFEVKDEQIVNHIVLDINNRNFNMFLKLEGSQDQKEWFTITDNYRIVGIANGLVNYHFSTLSFPDSKYRYYRLQMKGNIKPSINATARITQRKVNEANYKEFPVAGKKISNDKERKRTVIDIDLDSSLPVSYLKVTAKDDFDYYRPIHLEYLHDSVKTEKGWIYNYRHLTSDVLSSLEENAFTFSSITAQKFRIVIQNHDNTPLNIDHITAKGHTYKLLARYTEPADYFLVYGSQKASAPYYDIGVFEDKIPENLSSLTLGKEMQIAKATQPVQEALFENKGWLWAIMIVIMGVLGWFSLRMISKGE